MLNFRNTNIFFGLALGLTILFESIFGVSLLPFLLLILAYLGLLFYGSYFVHSGFYMPVICSAKTTEPVIAISFDDGPANNYTPAILDVLNTHHAEAAFFCVGKNLAGNEALLRRLHESGHLIGNHSFSHHPLFDLYSPAKMLADLRSMDDALFAQLGIRPRLFRPPYGVTNPNLRRAVSAGRYIAVGWNVRTFDTVIKNETKLLNKLSKSIQPGNIILFHDTCEITLNILPRFLQMVSERGYRLMRLDKMLKLDPYA